MNDRTAEQAPSRAVRREEKAAYDATYYAANREKIAATRAANREKRAAWYAAHREERTAYDKAYRAAHREERRAYTVAYGASHRAEILAWRATHREEMATTRAAYRASHPDARKTHKHRRRARIAGASGSYTIADWTDKLAEFNGRCAYCTVEGKMTVDHVIPISRGGSNGIDNIVPACGTCNYRKGTKTAAEFLRQIATTAESLSAPPR